MFRHQRVGFVNRLGGLVHELGLDILPARGDALQFAVLQQAGSRPGAGCDAAVADGVRDAAVGVVVIEAFVAGGLRDVLPEAFATGRPQDVLLARPGAGRGDLVCGQPTVLGVVSVVHRPSRLPIR